MSNLRAICTVCNYIYDEALGEPSQGIPSGLKFDDLSDDWRCPACGSAKEMFQLCSCVSFPIYEQTCVAHHHDAASNRNKTGVEEGNLSIALADVGNKSGRTICTVCNYIYDEAVGEPSQGIPTSLKFDDLADDWRCPACGSAKEMFQPCSCVRYQVSEQTCVAHSRETSASQITRGAAQSKIVRSSPVGQIVAQSPSLARVLEGFGIDYCCGGKSTLEEACLKKGVSVEEVLEALLATECNDERQSGPDWNTASLESLINHIVTTYHQPLRQELTRVAQLAEKVAKVHGINHPEMIEVLNVFTRFKAQLELHMQKEEMVLFPGIVSMEATGTPQIFGCGGGIEHPIDVMNEEHDDAGAALREMRRLTHDYEPPADGCSTFKVLLYSLAQIESDMHQHVHKENNILFPRALGLRKTALV